MNFSDYRYPYFSYYREMYVGMWSQVEKWTSLFTWPVEMLIGIPTNCLVILVFFMRDCGVARSARFFTILVSAMDLLVILAYYLPLAIGSTFHSSWYNTQLPMNSNWLCKFSRWLTICCMQSSAFALVAFSIERLYVISNPMKARVSNFSSNVTYVIVAIIALGFLGNSYLLVAYQVLDTNYPPYRTCSVPATSFLYVITNYATLYVELLPVVMELFINVALAIKLRNLMRNRVALGLVGREAVSYKERVASVALMTLSFARALSNVPDSALWSSLAFLASSDVSVFLLLDLFSAAISTTWLCGLVRSLNFFVYFAVIARFRNHVIRILRCRNRT